MQTFNTDADANISKWSRETTVSYLGKRIWYRKLSLGITWPENSPPPPHF